VRAKRVRINGVDATDLATWTCSQAGAERAAERACGGRRGWRQSFESRQTVHVQPNQDLGPFKVGFHVRPVRALAPARGADGDVAAARPGSARHVTPAAGSAAASRLSRGCLAAGRPSGRSTVSPPRDSRTGRRECLAAVRQPQLLAVTAPDLDTRRWRR